MVLSLREVRTVLLAPASARCARDARPAGAETVDAGYADWTGVAMRALHDMSCLRHRGRACRAGLSAELVTQFACPHLRGVHRVDERRLDAALLERDERRMGRPALGGD